MFYIVEKHPVCPIVVWSLKRFHRSTTEKFGIVSLTLGRRRRFRHCYLCRLLFQLLLDRLSRSKLLRHLLTVCFTDIVVDIVCGLRLLRLQLSTHRPFDVITFSTSKGFNADLLHCYLCAMQELDVSFIIIIFHLVSYWIQLLYSSSPAYCLGLHPFSLESVYINRKINCQSLLFNDLFWSLLLIQ